MIGHFITRLQQAGLDLNDEEIADSLWLAMQMGVSESRQTSEPKGIKANLPPPLPKTQSDRSETEFIEEEQPSQIEVYTENFTVEEPETNTGFSSDSLPFSVAAASALPNARQIGRALRPLMRKVASSTASVLDEEATVNQIAERDFWIPVLQPARERWLNLELVIEQSRSSFIWQDTVKKFKQVVEYQGAFRHVRTWILQDKDNEMQLIPYSADMNSISRTHNPRELIHPNRRGLVLVVSDCTSRLWQCGQIHQWLQQWSNAQPTAIVQLFPEHLWENSQLGLGYKVDLSAFTPGIANSQLQIQSLPIGEKKNESTLILPIVTLEAQSMKQWANVIAGVGSTQIPGFLLDLEFVEEQVQKISNSEQQATNEDAFLPEALVDRFLATASPTAQKLAGLMAAAPVSLPVVYLIQNQLLPHSTPVDIAEVFMSGMIARTSSDTQPPQYDFLPGVRRILNQAMLLDETDAVLETLSQYVAKKAGLAVESFAAFLFSSQEWDSNVQEQVLPFARIAVEVLRNLGGDYAAFAETLVRQPDSADSLQSSNEPFSLQTFEFEVATITFEDETQRPLRFTFEVATLQRKTESEIQETIETLKTELDSLTTRTQAIQKELTLQINPQTRHKLGQLELPRLYQRIEAVQQELETLEAAKKRQFWVIHRRQEEALGFVEELADGIQLELMQIPGGTFLMGASEREAQSSDSEKPQREVTVQPFLMGRYPITQAQWRIVAQWEQVERKLNPNPSRFEGDDLPVEKVSWYDAMEFCARLSRQTGQEYRLPTEAEWEYACRAGTQTPFHFGETITTDLANYDGNYTYGDAPKGEFRQKTTPVGYFGIANAFGLSDMHGNVWEWCLDSWHNNYEGAPIDGSAWIENDNRSHVLRGGSWFDIPRGCRSASRYDNNPDDTSRNIGFRVCRAAPRTL